jgi:hypothetical protein
MLSARPDIILDHVLRLCNAGVETPDCSSTQATAPSTLPTLDVPQPFAIISMSTIAKIAWSASLRQASTSGAPLSLLDPDSDESAVVESAGAVVESADSVVEDSDVDGVEFDDPGELEPLSVLSSASSPQPQEGAHRKRASAEIVRRIGVVSFVIGDLVIGGVLVVFEVAQRRIGERFAGRLRMKWPVGRISNG